MNPIIRISPTKARQNFFTILKEVVNHDVTYVIENKDMKEKVIIKKETAVVLKDRNKKVKVVKSLYGSLSKYVPKDHKFISVEREKELYKKSYTEHLNRKYKLTGNLDNK